MLENRLSLILFAFILVGCSGGGGSTLTTEPPSLKISCDEADGIQGCWVPIGCDEVDSDEANAEPIYGRNIYSFRADGTIQAEGRKYGASDCTGELVSSILYEWSESYSVGEEVLANDGTLSRELFILRLVDDFLVRQETIFAILNDNQLCTTDYLQLLPSLSILGKIQNGSTLNYDNCLLRL